MVSASRPEPAERSPAPDPANSRGRSGEIVRVSPRSEQGQPVRPADSSAKLRPAGRDRSGSERRGPAGQCELPVHQGVVQVKEHERRHAPIWSAPALCPRRSPSTEGGVGTTVMAFDRIAYSGKQPIEHAYSCSAPIATSCT